ncbi:OmpA family protein [Pseudoblastomonas halimionae]|uniref:OmpA family protein n=1 Tax=Alteriqipengyuania halimionae TaxID=1926630 RepID=A0A6I4U2V9_9SPHN|nr:OmpA family protein [Alteriqipengyuania halimionae]MXP10360.1 OmpA family protein [Alteriqipengyuania halimionae]
MNAMTSLATGTALIAALALPDGAALAQEDDTPADQRVSIYGEVPTDLEGLEQGPEIVGMIGARNDNTIRVMAEDGTPTDIRVSGGTTIRERGGFLGMGRTEKTNAALLNGLPVKVTTVRWNGGLIANDISFANDDLAMARMIRNGTAQGFAEQTAATDALRSRVGDIDNYNVQSTTAVYFDTGKWQLSQADQRKLCQAAAQANGTDNALLLVVGYTDSTGDQDFNQTLSERRAGRVVNFLQQECDWKPWRMLTPTGMAEADPTADNYSEAGRAQNRRVEVSVLVSKAVDGL